MQSEFSILKETGVLTLKGDLNAVHVDELRQKFQEWFLANTGIRHVVVDFREVTLVDSAGLGVLTRFLKWVGERGGALRLAGIPPRVRVVFRITRTDRLFHIHDTLEEALSAGQ